MELISAEMIVWRSHVTLRCFMGRETAVFVLGEQLLNFSSGLHFECEGCLQWMKNILSDTYSKIQSLCLLKAAAPDAISTSFWTVTDCHSRQLTRWRMCSLYNINSSRQGHNVNISQYSLSFFLLLRIHQPNSWRLLAQMESSMTRYFASYGTGWKKGAERPSMWLGWVQVRDTQTVHMLSSFGQLQNRDTAYKTPLFPHFPYFLINLCQRSL